MPKKKVSSESKELFAAVSGGLAGCWADDVRVDRVVVESNTCPSCLKSLEYRGWSNPTVYRAFGICEPCGYAREFFVERAKAAAELYEFRDKLLGTLHERDLEAIDRDHDKMFPMR
jgi:hypothetical protein